MESEKFHCQLRVKMPIFNKWGNNTLEHCKLLSCQPKVTVTSCFAYKVIKDLESIDHLCVNSIRRIGLIRKWSIDSRMLKWSVHVSVLLKSYVTVTLGWHDSKRLLTLLILLFSHACTNSLRWTVKLLTDSLYVVILNSFWLRWGRHKDLSTRKSGRPRWIIPLRIDKSLCLPKLKSITVLLYDFSFKNESFATFTFVVKDVFNLQSKTSKNFLTSFSNFY